MPVAEALALAALAAATLSDSPKETETYWVVVKASAPEQYTVTENPGQPPIMAIPSTRIDHDDTLVLQFTAPPGLYRSDFEVPIIRWYYRTYLPDLMAALARYRKARPSYRLKEKFRSLADLRSASDENLLTRADWPDPPSLLILGVVAEGQMAWAIEQDAPVVVLNKKQKMQLMLGHLVWHVLIADRWDRTRSDWVTVKHAHNDKEARTLAMSTVDPAEKDEAEPIAVFLGGHRRP